MTDQERGIVEVMARAMFDHEWNGVRGKPDYADDIPGYWRGCAVNCLSALDRAGYTVSGPKQESGT